MPSWADGLLEPEDGEQEQGGGDFAGGQEELVPQVSAASVGLMPEPVVEPEPQPVITTKTWRDFTLTEHVQAWLGVPPTHKLYLKKVCAGSWRANVYDPGGYKIANSYFLEITATSDGYQIKSKAEPISDGYRLKG